MRDPYEGQRDRWNNTAGEDGWECRRCGSDHAGRCGPCAACRRREREGLTEFGRRVAEVVRQRHKD